MPSRSDVPAVVAQSVSKRFLVRHNAVGSIKDRVLGVVDARKREQLEEFWALRDVSLTVRQGEAVGIVGRNGSGKSTLLKLIAGLMPPTSGAVFLRDHTRVGTMIELGVGFHPELTARENVHLSASIQGLSRAEIDALLPAIVEYSGLANFVDQPLRSFSSGMVMRLGFAVAANLQPDLLLLDEVFAVGDADFQARCIETMRGFRARGCTVLFVSHAAASLREVCSRAVVIDAGRLVYEGTVDDSLRYYSQEILRGGEALPGAEERASNAPGAHRRAMQTDWNALGPWVGAMLDRIGAKPEDFFLDIGCGSLPVAATLLPKLTLSRYWGVDPDKSLIEAGVHIEMGRLGIRVEKGHLLIDESLAFENVPYVFRTALVHSLAHRMPAEPFGAAVARAIDHLTPQGEMFVVLPTASVDHRQAMQRALHERGARVTQFENAAHPGGDEVWRVTRPDAA